MDLRLQGRDGKSPDGSRRCDMMSSHYGSTPVYQGGGVHMSTSGSANVDPEGGASPAYPAIFNPVDKEWRYRSTTAYPWGNSPPPRAAWTSTADPNDTV